jgi:hypothetical protein
VVRRAPYQQAAGTLLVQMRLRPAILTLCRLKPDPAEALEAETHEHRPVGGARACAVMRGIKAASSCAWPARDNLGTHNGKLYTGSAPPAPIVFGCSIGHHPIIPGLVQSSR